MSPDHPRRDFLKRHRLTFMMTSLHDPVLSFVKGSYQFGYIVLRYIPEPDLCNDAIRMNLGVSIFRWKGSKPEAITVVRYDCLISVSEFGHKGHSIGAKNMHRNWVKHWLGAFSMGFNRCLRPDSAIDWMRLKLAKEGRVIQLSEIAIVEASDLAAAAQDLALAFLGPPETHCVFRGAGSPRKYLKAG
jgi:hypothetical protein